MPLHEAGEHHARCGNTDFDHPAQAQLQINSQTVNVPVTANAWTEIKLDALSLRQGNNQIRWTVQRGTIELDWMDVKVADEAKQAVRR